MPALTQQHCTLSRSSRNSKQQKLVKLAKRSAIGWSIIAEYTADKLSEDSDDEKRLEKVNKAAGQKRWQRQQPGQKGASDAQWLALSWSSGFPGQCIFHLYALSCTLLLPTATAGLGVGQSGHRTTGVGASQQRGVVRPCFACSKMGHLRTYCPRAQASENKWYPPQLPICVSERVCEGKTYMPSSYISHVEMCILIYTLSHISK